MYSNQGVKDAYWEDADTIMGASANPPLNSVTFGTGAKYNVWKSLNLLLTGAYIHYLPVSAEVSVFDVTYNKDVVEVCLGASYKF
jgi:long-subunit fatty acid transport protein